MKKSDSYFELRENKTLKVFFLFIFGAVIAGLIFIFRFYFWPFLFALMLYLALKPFNDIILKFVKKRSLSSMIVILFLFALILIPLFFLLFSIADQTYQLYTFIQKEIDDGIIEDIYNSNIIMNLIDYFGINKSEIINKATGVLQTVSGNLVSSATSVISYPVSFFINFFFMLLMLFFLFKDGYKLAAIFYKTLPFPDDIEKGVIDRLKEVIRVLLTGNLMIMILQGLMVGLGLYFVDIPIALLGGSIAAILSLIPVVGTTFVWAPAVLYLVITGSYLSALFLGIWCLAWYLILENLIKPKVFGEKLNFHPVVFFFLLLGSIQAFGIVGVIVGPLLLTLFYSMWEIYKLLDEFDLHHYGSSADNIDTDSSELQDEEKE